MVAFGAAFQGLLHLEGDVADAEVMIGNLLQPASRGFQLARVVGVDEHVNGEQLVAGGDGPGVDVMNQCDALHVFQRLTKAVHVNVGGGAFQQNLEHLGHQSPGTGQYQQADEHAQNGVGEPPSEGQRQGAGGNNAD